jgi:acetyl esterase
MDLSRFDDEIAREWSRFPPPELTCPDVALSRSAYGEHFQRVASRTNAYRVGVGVEDISVPSLIDDHSIPVRVYRPVAPEKGRGLMYFHGGAFVMGDPGFEEEKCFAWARDSGCVVVSVDYRLAPEHPFPLPLEDCYSALLWATDHAEQLSIDRRRLGVAGCSAGGALAASVAQLCRDRNGPALALQMLLYPVLDASLDSASMSTMTEEEFRETERMWEYYLGGPRSDAPEYASPSHCRDLSGLAPAYIVVAELDVLRDEAIAYAQRLLSADVTTELHVWPRAPHAFDLFAPDANISRQSVRQQVDAIARFLG